MTAGMKGKAETVVTEKNTAKAMGSGTLDVFATPAMVALMEEAAWKCVAPELEPGMGTVGTLMNVQHTSATPLSMLRQSANLPKWTTAVWCSRLRRLTRSAPSAAVPMKDSSSRMKSS